MRFLQFSATLAATSSDPSMKLPEGKSRLDLVRAGVDTGVGKRGRLVVAIEKVAEDPNNERKTFRSMDGLVASIKAVGVIEPITVMPEEDGVFQIFTGHRRYRAAKGAGLTQVEVLIREPEDERARRIKSVVSNVRREDIGPVEMAEALQSLLDENNDIQTQDELARVIGKDKTWVSGMLRILTLPPKLLRKVGSTPSGHRRSPDQLSPTSLNNAGLTGQEPVSTFFQTASKTPTFREENPNS